MSQQPLVSIIIPCYNAEKYLKYAIRSALGQTYPNKEVIVVDDVSTDSSLDIIESFGPDVQCVRMEKNQGCSIAKNTGLAHSRGEFIQFLDADDVLVPDVVENKIRYFQSFPETDVVTCRIYTPRTDVHIDETFEVPDLLTDAGTTGYVRSISHWGEELYFFLIQVAGNLFRRSVLEEHGAFSTTVKAFDDFEINFRLRLCRVKFALLDQIGLIYRHNPAGLSEVTNGFHREETFGTIKTIVKLASAKNMVRGALYEKLHSTLLAGALHSAQRYQFKLARAYIALQKELNPDISSSTLTANFCFTALYVLFSSTSRFFASTAQRLAKPIDPIFDHYFEPEA